MLSSPWRRFLSSLTPKARKPRGDRRKPMQKPSRRLMLERLEDRLAPAVSSTFNNGALVLTFSGTNNDTLTIQSQNTAANDFKVNALAGTTLDGTAGNSETFTGVTSITVTGSNATGETVTFDTNSQNSVLSGAISLTDIDVISLTDSTGTGSLKAASFSESGGTNATTTLSRPLLTTGTAGVSITGDTTITDNSTIDASAAATGGITLTATRNIAVNLGAMIQTSSGTIMLSANEQATPIAGNFIGIDVGGATITSATGAVQLQGKGGNTGSDNIGILVHSLSTISSTGTGAGAATITLMGTGGPGTDNNDGIVFDDSSITSKDGAIQLTGTGGAGTTNLNVGIDLSAGSQVSATGTASVTLTGTGGGTGGATSQNDGVDIFGNAGGIATAVTANKGDISITGTAGPGANSFAINVGASGGKVATTGNGNITLTGDSLNIDTTNGVINAGTHMVTVVEKTAGTAINLGSASSSTQLGITNAELNRITAGTINIGDTNAGTFTVSAAIQHTGDANLNLTTGNDLLFNLSTSLKSNNGNLTLQANRRIMLNFGDSIQTSGGAITLNANQQATPTSGTFVGIEVNHTTITSATGAILFQGKGGDTGGTNIGIALEGGTVVSSTGTGTGAATITLVGSSGGGTSANLGILITDANTKVSSVDGAIQLTGTGGAGTNIQNDGIVIQVAAQVSSTGTATITLDGTGAGSGGGSAQNDGIFIVQGAGVAAVTSKDGNISITGTAGLGANSFAIDLGLNANKISSTGTANITLTGDSMNFDATSGGIDAGTNLVTLRQKTDVALTVDATQQSGHLSLTDAELGQITAGLLALGRNDTGFTRDLTINSAITTHTGFSSLSLFSGGKILDGTSPKGTDVTVATLFLTDKGGIGTSGSDFEFSVTSVNADSSAGNGDQFLKAVGTAKLGGFNALNAGTGTITLTGGTFQIPTSGAAGDAIADTSELTVNSPAILDLNGKDESIDGLNGNGKVTDSAATTTSTPTVGVSGGSGNFTGVLQDGNGKLALTKSGAGTETLSGTNTYTGATTVNGGTLLVNGSTAAGSAVAVNNGGTLGGTGTVGGSVTVNTGGTINPGTAGTVDTLTVGSLSFNGGTYQADLDPNANTADQIATAGAINLANPTQGVFSLNVLNNAAPAPSTVFTLIQNNSVNAIANPPLANAAENSSVTINGKSAVYTYHGGASANNFTLTVSGPVTYSGSGQLKLELDTAGTDLQFFVNNVRLDSRPLASITSIMVNGAATADTLTLDYTNGVFLKPISFDGGTGGDTLKLNNNTLTSLTYLATAPHAGTLVLNGDTTDTIVFQNLAPVVVTSMVGTTTVTINDNNPHTATFTAGPGAGNNTVTIDGGLESMTFTDPTVALVVNGNNAADTFTFTSLDAGFNSALTVNGKTASDTVNINTNLTLGSATSTGNVLLTGQTININGTIDTSAAGNPGDVSMTAGRNIAISNTGGIKTKNGNINLQANTAGTAAGNFVGIDVNAAAITSTVTGTISLTGTGGNDAATGFHIGVLVHGGATVQSSGTGTVTLNGTGGQGTDANYGVQVVDANSLVTSAKGNIQITGQGSTTATGAFNEGVLLFNGGQVTSTGTGAGAATVTLMGTAGKGTTSNYGVNVAGAGTLVTSVDGNIQITGQGGNGTTTFNEGILLLGQGRVTSTGAATITLNGTGGSGTDSNFGVSIEGAGTLVTSVNGNIQITGQGGTTATGNSNIGVRVAAGGQVTSTGMGAGAATITLMGTGGSGTDGNFGVEVVDSGSLVTSVNGNIQITGQGGTTAAGTGDVGILLLNGGQVTSTGMGAGAATIALNGTGGSGADLGIGVNVEGAGSLVTSVNGNIQITGQGSTTTTTLANIGVRLFNGGQVTSTGTGASAATITIMGTGGKGTNQNFGASVEGAGTLVTSVDGNIQITGQGSTTATGAFSEGFVLQSGGQVTSTGTAAITINGTGGSGAGGVHLGVELSTGTVSATGTGTVSITANSSGAASSPALSVDAASTISAASTADNITLTSNNAASVAGKVTTPGGLLLKGTAAGNFSLTNASNSVARLAASLSGNLNFTDSGNLLTIGTVGALKGVAATGGNVTIATNHDLTVSQAVSTATSGANAGAVTLTGGGANAGSNINVNAAVTGASATVLGGTGADTIHVTATGATPLLVNGKGGGDSIVVDFGALNAAINVTQTGGGTNTVTLNGTNAGDTFGVTGTLTTDGGHTVTYAGIQGTTVNGGAGSDTFNVTPSAAIPLTLNGGPPTPPTLPGDQLNVDLTGTSNPTLNKMFNPASGYSGNWSFGNRKNVNFTGIETLNPDSGAVLVNGGNGSNALVVTATGPIGGSYSLNGGAPVTLVNVTSFTFKGGATSDNSMTVNNPAGGLFAPSGGVIFNGSGGAHSNTLTVQGGTVVSEVFNYAPTLPHGGHSGNFFLVGASSTATYVYSQLSPLLVNVGAPQSVVFNLPPDHQDDQVVLEPTGTPRMSEILSSNGAFEATTFADAVQSVAVNVLDVLGAVAQTFTVVRPNLNESSAVISINSASRPTSTLNFDAQGQPVGPVPGALTIDGQSAVIYNGVGILNLQNAAGVNALYGPNTADRTSAFTGLTSNERFAQALYLDALGRAGARSELDGWATLFNAPGMSQAQAQNAIAAGIEHSAEARGHLVKSWYVTFLGRGAFGGEEQGFVNALLSGQTEEQVLSGILASQEFFNRAQTLAPGSSANEHFVQALYLLLLNRTGEASGVAGWVAGLPAVGRQGAALAFLTGTSGTEFRTDHFEGYYNALIHRPDDMPNLNNWVMSNLDMNTVRLGFEASAEFFVDG
jgi:hypothetical protein